MVISEYLKTGCFWLMFFVADGNHIDGDEAANEMPSKLQVMENHRFSATIAHR